MKYLFFIILYFFSIKYYLCLAQYKATGKHHSYVSNKKYIPVSKNAQFDLSTEPIKVSSDSSQKLRTDIIKYAEKFLGLKYKFAGQNPIGFDCAGYVSYVFRKYNIHLYTSATYMHKQGKTIELRDAREGDVIFFTSTTSKAIGHVGIVISKFGEETRFIHSSSGKEYCVKFECLEPNYIKRYLGVKRMIE